MLPSAGYSSAGHVRVRAPAAPGPGARPPRLPVPVGLSEGAVPNRSRRTGRSGPCHPSCHGAAQSWGCGGSPGSGAGLPLCLTMAPPAQGSLPPSPELWTEFWAACLVLLRHGQEASPLLLQQLQSLLSTYYVPLLFQLASDGGWEGRATAHTRSGKATRVPFWPGEFPCGHSVTRLGWSADQITTLRHEAPRRKAWASPQSLPPSATLHPPHESAPPPAPPPAAVTDHQCHPHPQAEDSHSYPTGCSCSSDGAPGGPTSCRDRFPGCSPGLTPHAKPYLCALYLGWQPGPGTTVTLSTPVCTLLPTDSFISTKWDSKHLDK